MRQRKGYLYLPVSSCLRVVLVVLASALYPSFWHQQGRLFVCPLVVVGLWQLGAAMDLEIECRVCGATFANSATWRDHCFCAPNDRTPNDPILPWCRCLVCDMTFDNPRSWADHSISMDHLERLGPAPKASAQSFDGCRGNPDEIPSTLRRPLHDEVSQPVMQQRRLSLVFSQFCCQL